MGYWARSGDFQAITDEETYQFTTGFQNVVWNDLYYNATNYDVMVKRSQSTGQGFYEAIGRIMKSHAFQMIVDIYGDVPYSQAFQGSANPTPAYDNGIDIYRDLFRQLDTAIALLKGPSAEASLNPEIGTSDIVYGGNATRWIKFANTLKLRMIVHVHETPGFDIAGEMAKITAEGTGYLGTGESAHLNPGFSATKPNPYYRTYVQDAAGTQVNTIVRANEYAIDYYSYDGDQRINRFYVPGNQGQRGVPYGQPANPDFAGQTLSTVNGPGLLPQGAASRAWILTSVESFFLQAEARQRGFITTGPTAQALLNTAIDESFIWLGLTATAAANYRAFNTGYSDVDYAVSTNKIWTIIMQKWFALNSIATYEVWTDYRRININGQGHFVTGGNGFGGTPIGFPEGPPISVWPANTSDEIPVRLLYPQAEYNYNAANVAAEGNINQFTSRIFWDIQ